MHGMPELFTTHILRFLTRALISHSESEKQKCVCVCACAFACAGERWSKSGFPISYFHTLSLVLSLLSSLHICVCNQAKKPRCPFSLNLSLALLFTHTHTYTHTHSLSFFARTPRYAFAYSQSSHVLKEECLETHQPLNVRPTQ